MLPQMFPIIRSFHRSHGDTSSKLLSAAYFSADNIAQRFVLPWLSPSLKTDGLSHTFNPNLWQKTIIFVYFSHFWFPVLFFLSALTSLASPEVVLSNRFRNLQFDKDYFFWGGGWVNQLTFHMGLLRGLHRNTPYVRLNIFWTVYVTKTWSDKARLPYDELTTDNRSWKICNPNNYVILHCQNIWLPHIFKKYRIFSVHMYYIIM
jgi:hypothetical protein